MKTVKLHKKLYTTFGVMRRFCVEVVDSHKFFVKETPKFIAGHREAKWAIKEGWGWSKTY